MKCFREGNRMVFRETFRELQAQQAYRRLIAEAQETASDG